MGISCYCAVSNFPLSLFFLFTESIFSFTARVFLLPRKFLFRCELFTFAVALVGQCNNTFNNKFEARDQHEERNTGFNVFSCVKRNKFHNVFRLFDVLSNFPFTASETMGDYYL